MVCCGSAPSRQYQIQAERAPDLLPGKTITDNAAGLPQHSEHTYAQVGQHVGHQAALFKPQRPACHLRQTSHCTAQTTTRGSTLRWPPLTWPCQRAIAAALANAQHDCVGIRHRTDVWALFERCILKDRQLPRKERVSQRCLRDLLHSYVLTYEQRHNFAAPSKKRGKPDMCERRGNEGREAAT